MSNPFVKRVLSSLFFSTTPTCNIRNCKMPPRTLLGSADSKNKFEDLSGVNIAAYSNPYDALIEACGDDPVETLSFVLPLPSTASVPISFHEIAS